MRQRAEFHGLHRQSTFKKRQLSGRHRGTVTEVAAVTLIQAHWRGVLDRTFATYEKRAQRFSARLIQGTWRRGKLRKAMATRIQRASHRRIGRRNAKSIFEAARAAMAWRTEAAKPETREHSPLAMQKWARGKQARARAVKLHRQRIRLLQLVKGGYPVNGDQTAARLQARARGNATRKRLKARRSVMRDVADWREERAQHSAAWFEHESQLAEEKIKAARLDELKKEAKQLMESHVAADNPIKVERKYKRGGRVFGFLRENDEPVLDLGDPRVGLLPETHDDDRDDDPIEPPTNEHEGCIVQMWTWLHAKHPVTNEGCANVRLPDTIVYKYRQPCVWYFSDRNGNLRRKKRDGMTWENIMHVFTRGGPSKKPMAEDAIVALYTFSMPADEASGAQWQEFKGQRFRKTTRQTVVEHLTAAQLKDFLLYREKVYDGQLQRYIVPRRGVNSTFVAVWSPHLLHLEKWVNSGDAHNRDSSVYARTVTHEGEPFSAFQQPIRGERFPMDVQRTCRSIAQHTAAVSRHRICISRMWMTFKLDEEGMLWLSACTSLRFTRSAATQKLAQQLAEPKEVPPAEAATPGAKEPRASLSKSASAYATPTGAATSASGTAEPTPQPELQPLPRGRPQSASSAVSRRPQTPNSKDATASKPRRPQSAGMLSSVLESEAPLDLTHGYRPAPGINPQLHAHWTDPTARIEEGAQCAACGRAYVQGSAVKLPYHVLINSQRRESGSLAGGIPKLIAEKHPSLAVHQFKKLVRSQDPGFLSRTISVCHPCWMAHVARGAPALHSDGAPRSASTATLQRERREQRVKDASQRLALLKPSRSDHKPPISAAARMARSSSTTITPLHRAAPESSSSVPAIVTGGSGSPGVLSRSVSSPTSWAARDLIYLIGHAHRREDRRDGEYIVPQVSEWAASEIAERGVSTGSTRGGGGLSESKVLELFERMGEFQSGSMNNSNDLKDLLSILKE